MTYKFKATAESINKIMQIAEHFAADSGCTHAQQMNFLLAAEELAVNIINYAYDNKAGEMEFSLERHKDSILLSFCDEGRPFDPLNAKDPDTSLSLEERTPGGLGIYLVKKLSTSLKYRRDENKNIVTATFACGDINQSV